MRGDDKGHRSFSTLAFTVPHLPQIEHFDGARHMFIVKEWDRPIKTEETIIFYQFIYQKNRLGAGKAFTSTIS